LRKSEESSMASSPTDRSGGCLSAPEQPYHRPEPDGEARVSPFKSAACPRLGRRVSVTEKAPIDADPDYRFERADRRSGRPATAGRRLFECRLHLAIVAPAPMIALGAIVRRPVPGTKGGGRSGRYSACDWDDARVIRPRSVVLAKTPQGTLAPTDHRKIT
jgi:hypothetical protein